MGKKYTVGRLLPWYIIGMMDAIEYEQNGMMVGTHSSDPVIDSVIRAGYASQRPGHEPPPITWNDDRPN